MVNDVIDTIDTNVSRFQTWTKVVGGFMVIIFFATMIYFQINDNTKQIKQNKKEQVYKSSENKKEMGNKLKVLEERMDKRYQRENIEDKEVAKRIKELADNQIKVRIEQAYLRGYLKGKEDINTK